MTEKQEKFKILANNRVNKAIKTIRLIGNLANKSHYSYKDGDTKKIISALEVELRTLKEKFKSKNKKSLREFDLND